VDTRRTILNSHFYNCKTRKRRRGRKEKSRVDEGGRGGGDIGGGGKRGERSWRGV
jgi:hypothetical protein